MTPTLLKLRWITARLCAALLVVAAFGPAQPARASHTSELVDLPGVFGNQQVAFSVIDALPSGRDSDTSPRTVVLDFSIELLGDWFGSEAGLAAPFEVIANGDTILRTTFSTFLALPQAFPGSYPDDAYGLSELGLTEADRLRAMRLTFPLYYVEDCCTHIGVIFRRTGADTSGTWSLHDVSIDWSRPIPEPATIAMVGLGLAGLGARGTRIP